MSKDVILTSYGFYKPELTVHFLNAKLTKNTYFYNREHEADYQICLIKKGETEFLCRDKTYPLTNGDVFIAKPFEEYSIKGCVTGDIISVVIISFHQSLYKEVKGDEKYLRVFDGRPMGERNRYKKDAFHEFSIYDSVISPLQTYINHNLGLCHFSSVVSTLITRLDMAYDQLNHLPATVNSNEYAVKVYDYIISNCMSGITAEEVCKKFNVSKWYLDKVTNRFFGKPFYRTVKSLRMWYAKKLMGFTTSLLEISKNCGYSDYSAFYRSYLSFFGVTPKKDLDSYLENKVFLSDKNNDTMTRIE